MKISFNKFFGVSFFLFAVSVWAGKWTIDAFDNSPEPGDPDKYIAAESGKGLTPVRPEQVTRQEDVLYIRQKFEDDAGRSTYQMFRGKAKPAAKSLGKISLAGIPYQTLLKMKLFYKRNSDPEDDLEGVYYDGQDIFVEGEDPVYINLNGKMEELKPMAFKEFEIKITSDPSGAAVSVGSASRGTTPATFTVSASKTIAVVVSREGHYPLIKPVTPADKGVTEEKFTLTARTPLTNPATAFKTQLDAAAQKKDATAIRNIRTSVMQILSTYNAETQKNIAAALGRFPENPPKAAKETPEDFNARRNLWTNAQNRERDALNREAESYFKELKELLARIDSQNEEMDFGLKYEYIPSRALQPTNLGIRDFTVNASVDSYSVKFKYNNGKLAYGSIPRTEIEQNINKVHGVLKLWNTPNENGDFASVYDIAFFYNETPLQTITKGTFTMGNATNASRNTERDLNSRIARLP
ncbi:MAG: PEGA domain-containing protein, partial [Fibromonadales bacterium]|nr:PEGA domain-containing protein [Fibromonadales bacterium]